ncbi:hypothetical protein K2F43_09730 [Clostridium estertheticum]|uniref:hypothetical protein n=1 Tax=Clostridium estertheticum TaxID=238834 RepID=UPI001C6E6222|nr:hypothetical protein [Clostridium estertheticum]MBW9171489.1 hypothetical protein [Clostridium estertheticum]WLC76605.1 hypothetical protein KTC99_07370 [Clostridium estertheticum]
MFSLMTFEFKKLAKKRTNIITVLISVILTIIFFALPIIQFEAYDTKGNQYTGFKAIALKKEQSKELSSSTITEETVTKAIKEYQKLFSKPENIIKSELGDPSLKENVYIKYVSPKFQYFSMISQNYEKPDENLGLSNLLNINLQDGSKFYETRNNKISALLNMNEGDRNYSAQEKTFWLNKSSKIQEPYTYGYYKGWYEILSNLGTLIFTLLVICITIAPVFAGEYQCGADAVILASKYGKTKVITAKIISAFAFATMVFFLNVIFAVAIPLLCFGIEGWNLPMQIHNTIIPYPVTFASCTFICICVSYAVMLGTVSFTLMLSARLKTPFTVLIIDVVVLLISFFMKPGADNGVFSGILYLLPYKSLTADEFASYLSYSFGGLTISLILMRIVVYGVMAIVFLPFVKNAFRKHQVQ